MTSERLTGTSSFASYSAMVRDTYPSRVRPARVWTLSMSMIPGTKTTGRPISVARPTASSTASRPAILRTNSLRPRVASWIKRMTKRQMVPPMMRIQNLSRSNHWAVDSPVTISESALESAVMATTLKE